jgi:hypothetical protein
MLGESETFLQTGSIAMPTTLALVALAIAALMLWRGFCTAWAAIHNGDDEHG